MTVHVRLAIDIYANNHAHADVVARSMAHHGDIAPLVVPMAAHDVVSKDVVVRVHEVSRESEETGGHVTT
jgi:hypothetical protein